MKKHKLLTALFALLAAALTLGVAACGGDEENDGAESGGEALSGEIVIDGSSTVAPLSEQIAALFQEENPDVRITVGTAGTGGGFERFCAGETDISDASRQIEPEEEKLCADGNVEFEEITVANDALSVVVNPDNPVTCVSTDQLNEVYGPDSDITSWADVPDLDEPFEAELAIFSPGADSGTFDYFSEAVNGEEGEQRRQGINIVGENDNATVTGVAGDEGGIGYFGFSFFNENQDQLKALEIENEDGDCVPPAEETAQDGSYNPLGRQLYIYPSADALQEPVVQEFVQFYLETANEVIPQAGFIGLTDEQLSDSQANVDRLLSGSGGSGGSGEETTE